MTDAHSAIEELLREHDLYDAEIIAHGFVPYLRDYRLLVHRLDYAPFGMFEYLFVGCMEARYVVTLPGAAISMDDRLTVADPRDAPVDGFVWSVASACSAEEGVTLTATSERAKYWRDRLGIPMSEIVVGTNVYQLTLVFHDLLIRRAPGATPSLSAS